MKNSVKKLLLFWRSMYKHFWLRVTKYRSPKNDFVVVVVVIPIFQIMINNRPFRVGLIIQSSYENEIVMKLIINWQYSSRAGLSISEMFLKEEWELVSALNSLA